MTRVVASIEDILGERRPVRIGQRLAFDTIGGRWSQVRSCQRRGSRRAWYTATSAGRGIYDNSRAATCGPCVLTVPLLAQRKRHAMDQVGKNNGRTSREASRPRERSLSIVSRRPTRTFAFHSSLTPLQTRWSVKLMSRQERRCENTQASNNSVANIATSRQSTSHEATKFRIPAESPKRIWPRVPVLVN